MKKDYALFVLEREEGYLLGGLGGEEPITEIEQMLKSLKDGILLIESSFTEKGIGCPKPGTFVKHENRGNK